MGTSKSHHTGLKVFSFQIIHNKAGMMSGHVTSGCLLQLPWGVFLNSLDCLETRKWSVDAYLGLGGKYCSQLYPNFKSFCLFRAASFKKSIMSISATVYFVNNVKDKRNVWGGVCLLLGSLCSDFLFALSKKTFHLVIIAFFSHLPLKGSNRTRPTSRERGGRANRMHTLAMKFQPSFTLVCHSPNSSH